MTKRHEEEHKTSGTWNFRDIPTRTMRRAKIVAALEGKSIKALLVELIDQRWAELERRGLLTKT